jgi:hypothetical protein
VKRSSPLCVELLEDRCVPAVDLLLHAVAPALAVAPPTTFVIDPGLINPNSPPVQTAPPANYTVPALIILPIASPFMP